MLKPMLLSATLLFGFLQASSTTPATQQTAPAPAPVPAQPPPPPPTTIKNPVKATPESKARAKKMYGYDCAMCHNANGNGATDMATAMHLTLSDWTDPKVLAARTDGELYDVIKNGKEKMPAEGDRAKADEVWNLVLYIRGLANEQGASPAKPAGAQ